MISFHKDNNYFAFRKIYLVLFVCLQCFSPHNWPLFHQIECGRTIDRIRLHSLYLEFSASKQCPEIYKRIQNYRQEYVKSK